MKKADHRENVQCTWVTRVEVKSFEVSQDFKERRVGLKNIQRQRKGSVRTVTFTLSSGFSRNNEESGRYDQAPYWTELQSGSGPVR